MQSRRPQYTQGGPGTTGPKQHHIHYLCIELLALLSENHQCNVNPVPFEHRLEDVSLLICPENKE